MDLRLTLAAALRVYTIVVFVRVIFSWLPPEHRENEFYRFLYKITEPVLAPFRALLPPMGGIDFSAIVAILILDLVRRALL